MTTWGQRQVIGSIIWCMCIGLVGCATPVAKPAADIFVDRAVEIVVVPPLIEYRDVHTNDPIEATAEDRAHVESAVSELVVDQLKASGLTARLLPADERLRLRAEANGWTLCDEPLTLRVFCLRGRFYVGPGAFYDPMSGGIKHGGSRLVLEARLLSNGDRQVIWVQTAQVRESTAVSRGMLKDLIEVLLNTLKTK